MRHGINNMLGDESATIGVLSKKTGCKVETIRYYERIGLVPAPPRSSGGHRLYNKNHFKRLSFIRRSRELGFPLNTIRDLLALADDSASCGQIKELTLQHLGEVRRKLIELRRMEKILKELAKACESGEQAACPVLDALFE